jgi:hypothetical protein
VVNADGLLVGQLSGICGFNVYDSCDANSNATVDGAFASYFDQVAPWLDPEPGGCRDGDGDGFEAASCGGDDCNDSNAAIFPGAEEVCNNNVDDNCNGSIDENCVVCDVDADGFDSYGCGGSDCDDLDPNSFPGAPEICGDDVDNNCDGVADEDCLQCDLDGDGYQSQKSECAGADCDDTNAAINPGMAEDCNNDKDDDCDGTIDGDDSDCATCVGRKLPCTSDDECCSGKCHQIKKWCK